MESNRAGRFAEVKAAHFFVVTMSKLNLFGPCCLTSILCLLLLFHSGGTFGFGDGGSGSPGMCPGGKGGLS